MSCLERLLDKIRYSPATDRLWFVGDLISRGPDSEAVLRFIKSLKDKATVVLGNHDLHFLALSAGLHQNKSANRLDRLLQAPDLDELTDFVRHLPLAHFEHFQAHLLLLVQSSMVWQALFISSIPRAAP